jgi:lactoylglutathione lyase
MISDAYHQCDNVSMEQNMKPDQSRHLAINRLNFVSIQVNDLKRSQDFYCNVLGFVATTSPNPAAIVMNMADGGAAFAIREPMLDLSAANQLGWGISLWFGCDDIEVLRERVVASGGTVLQPPQDSPFGRIIVIQDPDGYSITFNQPQMGGKPKGR